MNKPFRFFIRLFFGLLLFNIYTQYATCQTYSDARKLAFAGQRGKARDICRNIMNQSFDADVAILMGRTYAWDRMYDSARIVLQLVLSKKSDHYDALDALSDVEYWDHKYTQALAYCDQALKKTPNDEHFLYKKAKILRAKGDYLAAEKELNTILQKKQLSAEALQLLNNIKLEKQQNKLSLQYTFDYYSSKFNRDNWHLIALQYLRKTSIGPVVARFNYANRYSTNGYQFEMDAYPHLNENNYLYLNAGFSQNTIFPKQRGGIELYHNFPNTFEGSLGVRALFFDNSQVVVYTVTIGKYTGNYWFSLRPFITTSSSGTSISGLLNIRRYFAVAENFIGIRLGYGVSPDDRQNMLNSTSALKLKSQSLRLEYSHLLAKQWTINVGSTWYNEELPVSGYATHLSFDGMIIFSF
jgi:YaiO family outer membrane protein